MIGSWTFFGIYDSGESGWKRVNLTLARFHGTFAPQVTFGETLVIFTIIFLFAMVVAGVYNGNHQKMFYGHDDAVTDMMYVTLEISNLLGVMM